MHTIKPVNGSSMWEMIEYSKPLPPISKIMPCRPSTKRKRDAIVVSDGTRTYTCNNCLQRGHNTRSCKNGKQDRPPKIKKKRGRPRIHEPGVMGSRGGTTVMVNPIGMEDDVGMEESKDMGFETKDASLCDIPVTQTNKDVVVDVHYHDKSQDIIYETQDAAKQEKMKILRYTCAEIEEALSITEDGEGIAATQAPVYDKKARRSERIVKIKLSKRVYDKDGGGSCVEKALTLD